MQDTLPTHASRRSQRVALAALEELGPAWVAERVASLAPVRAAMWPALAPWRDAAGAAPDVPPPPGAFYFTVPLPKGASEEAVVRTLADEHALLLLPGAPFGAPLTLRLSYGGIETEREARDVAARLERAVCVVRAGPRW